MLILKSKQQRDPIQFLNGLLFFFVLAALLLRLISNYRSAINLDEFNYLSYVYQFSENSLKEYLTSFHSVIFSKLLSNSAHEISLIVFFRFLLFLLFLGNCYFTFLLAKIVMYRTAALFSVLCYLSLSYVFWNACSFRPDSICSFLFLLSLVCLVYSNFSRIGFILSAINMAVSLMFTIKVYLHFFLILMLFGVMILRSENKKVSVINVSIFFITFIFIYFSLNLSFGHYAFNDPFKLFESLIPASSNAFKTQFPGITISSSIKYFLLSLQRDTLVWFLILVGYLLFLRDSILKKMDLNFTYLPFISLLLFPLIYRNSFPYFYIFIASPPIIYSGYLIHSFLLINFSNRGFNNIQILFVSVISFFSFLLICSNFYWTYNLTNKNQRLVVESIHKMYDKPIPYIDGCSMISSFPQVSFFMSSWGMKSYLSNNEPIIRNILVKKRPKLLLANTEVLDLSKEYEHAKSARGQSLLIADWQCLKEHFIVHWGIIYVPGKEFTFTKNMEQFDFEILIPDEYTIEASQPVIIDDCQYNPYDTIQLKFGFHKIKSNYAGKVTLRIGQKLYRPQQTPVSLEDLYSKFG